ncbi:hypothetical protein FGG08_005415 [Glutinoglossum americanum]|uniref:Ubiquitin-like domain-containing protein n=1 Tax=Glutinoglossum americanum TaxID=1670608 RepID=A0A9P8HUK1_9PEZI|nr:hypothetical protein FGG08_005415 [Glutinoglossum americanum]
MDIIQPFLDRTKKYDRRLGNLGSSGFAHGLGKVGWTLFKAEDMKKLKETLHARLSVLGVLIAAANLDTDGIEQSIPTTDTKTNNPRLMPRINEISMRHETKFPKQTHRNTSGSIDSGTESEEGISLESIYKPGPSREGNREQNSANFSTIFSFSSFSPEELRSMISKPGQQGREDQRAVRAPSNTSPNGRISARHNPSSRLYAVGRKFSFPWHLCNTWKRMEELIKQAFLHVEVIGPHVAQGHYDLIGPASEIILPQVWEAMVQPDWVITMHMWPIPEPPSPPPPLLPPELPQAPSPPLAASEPPNQSEPEPEFSQAEEMVSPPPPTEPTPKLSGESAPQGDPSAQEEKGNAPTEATNTDGVGGGDSALLPRCQDHRKGGGDGEAIAHLTCI